MFRSVAQILTSHRVQQIKAFLGPLSPLPIEEVGGVQLCIIRNQGPIGARLSLRPEMGRHERSQEDAST